MKLEKDNIVKRIDELIDMGKKVLSTRDASGGYPSVDFGQYKGWRSACLSFLDKLYGSDHVYVKEFESSAGTGWISPIEVEANVSILTSVKNEIEGGWLFTVKGLVSAEIFSDFLDMATYLLSEGYKDPAAVIIGSVLEEHLRQLCLKSSVPIDENGKPKKADRLNGDLSNASVYNKLDQKNVTAWLDLRNKAAHGNYGEYKKEQVDLMLSGVTNFMTRNPI